MMTNENDVIDLKENLLTISPKYDEYINKNRFDLIAFDISKAIISIVPFLEAACLDCVLHH